jgi:hypothetical protein
MLATMEGRTYRLTVDGELSDTAGLAFEGMTLTRMRGKTVLVGRVRDQAGLQDVFRRISDLGLTLLEARVADDVPGRPPAVPSAEARRNT